MFRLSVKSAKSVAAGIALAVGVVETAAAVVVMLVAVADLAQAAREAPPVDRVDPAGKPLAITGMRDGTVSGDCSTQLSLSQ